MTAAELVEALKNFPPDAKVYVEMTDEYRRIPELRERNVMGLGVIIAIQTAEDSGDE